jgi:quercetin dioxygenase-like cupin family protein
MYLDAPEIHSSFMISHHRSLPVYFLNLISLIVVFALYGSCRNENTLPDPLEAGWQGETVCEVIQDDASLRVLKCTFPPGVGHERHYHKKHFGYTLAGGTFRITDTAGTREVDIPTGYSFANERIEWHEVLNIGDSTAVFLIVEPK